MSDEDGSSSSSSSDGSSDEFYNTYVDVELARIGLGSLYLFVIIVVMVLVVIRRNHVFGKLAWKNRLIFCVVCLIWVSGFFLREPDLEDTSIQCNAFVFIVNGFCEASFCLLLVFFFRNELAEMRSYKEGNEKQQRSIGVVPLTLLSLIPICAFHVLVLVFQWLQLLVPRRYYWVLSEKLQPSPCPIPLVSLIGTSGTTLICLIAINVFAGRLASKALNVMVATRITRFRFVVTVGLIVQLLERYGLQFISVDSIMAEYWLGVYYLTVCITTASTIWMLVLRPVLHDVSPIPFSPTVLDLICKGRPLSSKYSQVPSEASPLFSGVGISANANTNTSTATSTTASSNLTPSLSNHQIEPANPFNNTTSTSTDSRMDIREATLKFSTAFNRPAATIRSSSSLIQQHQQHQQHQQQQQQQQQQHLIAMETSSSPSSSSIAFSPTP